MSGKFLRFKNKLRKIRIAKTLLAGAAFGCALSGLFLLLTNFAVITAPPILALPIGVAAAAIVGLITYFASRVSDKALAVRLDSKLGLKERVQTMLEFKKERGTIYEMQRSDTRDKLLDVPLRRIRAKSLLLFGLLFLVGVGILVSAFIFKPEEEPTENDPPTPYSVTSFQIAGVRELITFVDSSSMESPYKESISASLSVLLEDLKAVDTVDKKNAALKKATDAILKQTSDSSSLAEILSSLWLSTSENVRSFAKGLDYHEWDVDEPDKDFNVAVINLRQSFRHSGEANESPTEDDITKLLTETAAVISITGTDIGVALINSKITASDVLYSCLNDFVVLKEENKDGTHLYGFTKISQIIYTVGYEEAQNELDALLESKGAMLFSALEQQSVNTNTGEYVLIRLGAMFDVDVPDFERPKFPSFSDDDGENAGNNNIEDNNENLESNRDFPSDENVLDTNTNESKPYGDVIQRYYQMMLNKTEGDTYTEEEKEAIKKYFDILYGNENPGSDGSN